MTSNATALRPRGWPDWVRIRTAQLVTVPDLVFVALTAALIYPVASAPIGSGDYGQWLMVSRYYSGEEVPAYRDILAVAPIVPALLAAVRGVIGDPFLALNVTRICIMAALILGFYLAGGSLFRSRAAGVLAAALAFSLTERFLELFAFGGLLQAASLAFMLGGLASLGRAAVSPSQDRAWWVVATACFALAVLSHAGSVVIVVPVGAATGLTVVALTWRRRGGLEWIRVLSRALILPSLAVAYWVVVLLPANQGYADNPATESFRGPDRLFEPLLTPERLTVWLVVLGFAAIGQGVSREIWARRPGGYCLTAAWAGSTWGVLLLAIATGTATDYPRFAGPLLAPLAVGAGAALAELVQSVVGAVPSHSRTSATLAGAVGLVMLFGGPDQFGAFATHNRSYALGERSSIEALAERVAVELPHEKSVLVLAARDGKWIEGLTGHASLFANKTRYSFREHEWERSVAADAMIRSTTTAVSGLASAKFMDSASPPRGEDVPRELLIGANHDGEWLDLLRMPEAKAFVALGNGLPGTTLAAMKPVALHRAETPEFVRIQTLRTATLAGETITWSRTVTLRQDSAVVDVVDEFASRVPVREVQLTVSGFTPGMSAAQSDNGAKARFPQMGRRQPQMELTLVDRAGQVELEDGGMIIRAAGTSRVHLQFEAKTAGEPISRLSLLNPHQLMEDYHVGAAVLRMDGAYESRLKRLQTLGLCERARAGTYVLLTLECGDRQPPPNDSREPEVGTTNQVNDRGDGG